MRITYIIIVILAFYHSVHSKERIDMVTDLKYEWMIYEQNNKKFAPYLGQKTNSLFFKVIGSENPNYLLRLELPKETYVYINDKIRHFADSTQELAWSIDSLSKALGNEMVFSFYRKDLEPKELKTYITLDRKTDFVSKSSYLFIESRVTKRTNEQLIIVGIFMFSILLGYRSGNYRLFAEYFSPTQIFKMRQRFDTILSLSLFSSSNLSYFLLYGILLGSSVSAISIANPQLIDSDWSPIGLGLAVGSVGILMLLLKYPLIVAIGALFQTRKMQDIHFIMYLRYSLNLALLFFGISITNGIIGGTC